MHDEEIKNNPDYITRSKITRAECDRIGIPKEVSLKDIVKAFDDIPGEVVTTGNPYNQNQQRHTKFVHKFELYRKTIKS